MKNLLFTLLWLFPSLLVAQVLPDQLDAPEDFLTLQATIDSILQQHDIPGAQVVIVSRDSVLWKQNFGLADLATKQPVTDETMFRIGSVTKSFIAVSVMQQVEHGKLKLNIPLRNLAPEIPFSNPWADQHPITIAHLLEHTTGWDDMHLNEYATNGDGWTTLQGLQFHPDSKTSRWAPGQHFSYCNSGPPAAAFALEKVTNETIEDYVEQNVFKPLQMPHSTLLKTPHVDQHLSKGYYGEHNTEAKYWHIIDRAAGAINSNATEMANYLQFFLNRGRHDSLQLLSAKSIARIETPQTTLAAKAGVLEGYGLHIGCSQFKDAKICGHNGGMTGFLTEMRYFPQRGIGYFFSINKNGGGMRDIGDAINNHIVDPKGTWEKPAPRTSGYDAAVTGYYRSATSRNQMMRGLEWIFSVGKLYERNDSLFYKDLLSDSEGVMHVDGPRQFREYAESGRSTAVAIVEDIDGQTIMQSTSYGINAYQTSGWAAWGGIAAVFVSILLALSVLPVSLIGLAMWLSGRSIRFKRARFLPLLWGINFLVLGFVFIAAQEIGDVIVNLGQRTEWSVTYFFASISLGVLGLLCGLVAFQSLRRDMHGGARVYYFLCNVGILFLTGYFAYWGLIGLRTWVY
ncbi:MAG: serine hydrolase [Bacteroidota bacterium]